MDLVTSAQPVAPITVEEMWRMQWKRGTIRTLKETRCHSETNRGATHGRLYLRR